VADGVVRLLQNTNWIMTYTPGEAGERTLTEVRGLGASVDAPAPVPEIGWSQVKETASETRILKKAVAADLEADRDTRLRAVRDLARQPDAAATKDLALFLSHDEDPLVRRIAAIGLGKLSGGQARVALTTALADEDTSVRRRAIQGLGRIGGNKAAQALGEALLEDRDPHVRRFAAVTLGKIPAEVALELLHAAAWDPDMTVRQAVAALLARSREF
jgi:HEAT repeat protein